MALHAPADGVHVQGEISEERLNAALRRARALLAPLRFGAGLKGKILHAWAQRPPVVTTPIGAEAFALAAEAREELGDATAASPCRNDQRAPIADGTTGAEARPPVQSPPRQSGW